MRLSIPVLLLMLNLGPVQAQGVSAGHVAEARDESEKTAQKIKMVKLILQRPDLQWRLEASDDPDARELLARAAENFQPGKDYFERGQYLEANAVLDYVLRTLSAGLQLLGAPEQKKINYRHLIQKLDAFALPEWRDLDELETELLQQRLAHISLLRDQAVGRADTESWDEAISMLDEAYRLKVSLIDDFNHETQVVYELEFGTVEDEYRYLLDRAYHYLDLVQVAMAQSEVEEPMQKLAERYLYNSMLNLEIVDEFETRGKFAEALPVLGKSINLLSSVLKMLGIKI